MYAYLQHITVYNTIHKTITMFDQQMRTSVILTSSHKTTQWSDWQKGRGIDRRRKANNSYPLLLVNQRGPKCSQSQTFYPKNWRNLCWIIIMYYKDVTQGHHMYSSWQCDDIPNKCIPELSLINPKNGYTPKEYNITCVGKWIGIHP